MTAVPPEFDVAIVGAGPVGAALACLLLRDGVVAAGRLLLLDRQIPDWSAPLASLPPDLRVFAVSRASERILRHCGAWEGILAADVAPYEHMCVWVGEDNPHGEAALRFDAAEVAEPNLGCIVRSNLLQGALLRSAAALGAQFCIGSLQSLEFGAQAVVAQCDQRPVSARLLAGADGAQSRLRELAGLGLVGASYGQTAIVANVASELPHQRTAWQRFLRPGTLALLPLADAQCSIVWSLPTSRAEYLLRTDTASFDRQLTDDSALVLGQLKLASQRVSFPLRRLASGAYVGERCALAGDAAHVVHPLAGQGVNLGLLDAAALADTLTAARREGEDLGAPRVLRNYERWRRSENVLMAQALDGFNRFLATGADSWSQWAQGGLRAVAGNGPLRRWFAGRALGTDGDLPRAARIRP
jgi:2-octaprenylphenol hydroxylase